MRTSAKRRKEHSERDWKLVKMVVLTRHEIQILHSSPARSTASLEFYVVLLTLSLVFWALMLFVLLHLTPRMRVKLAIYTAVGSCCDLRSDTDTEPGSACNFRLEQI